MNLRDTLLKLASGLLFCSGAAVAAAGPAPAAPADAALADLLLVHEQQKLGRDVYLNLYQQWQLPEFARMARSGEAQLEATRPLLRAQLLEDPAAREAVGEFGNAGLQAFYLDLTTTAAESATSALYVAALMEEVRLQDSARAIRAAGPGALGEAYARLMCGSRNHLRALARQLDQRAGAAYAAQVLPAPPCAHRRQPDEACGG